MTKKKIRSCKPTNKPVLQLLTLRHISRHNAIKSRSKYLKRQEPPRVTEVGHIKIFENIHSLYVIPQIKICNLHVLEKVYK